MAAGLRGVQSDTDVIASLLDRVAVLEGLVTSRTAGRLIQCTSGTRPAQGLYRGLAVMETDTGNIMVWYGPATGWLEPWNMPWGEMAAPATSGVLTTSAGTELVLLTSAAFTAVAGRRLRVYANLTGSGTTVADQFRFTVRRGTTIAGAAIKVGPRMDIVTANARFPIEVETLDTSTAGSTQFVCCAARLSGGGTFTMESIASFDNFITVQDIGPAVGASAPSA
jgi:hypothetical protein